MTEKIFYPKTHLFPHHPQILHQMVLQLFLLTDDQGVNFPTENMPHAMIMPYGSYFDIGTVQATGYRYRLGFHKPKKVVLISCAELDDSIDILGCDYDALHSFLGEMKVDSKPYKKLKVTKDNELFAKHADAIVCQLPFLRSYQKIDAITPIIINTQKTDQPRKKFWSALQDPTGSTCYIVCTNMIDNVVAHLSNSYEDLNAEQFLMFDPEKKTS